MQRLGLKNKNYFGVSGIFASSITLVSCLLSLCFSPSVSAAHTATITTSGSVTLNVASNPYGDSTALGSDLVTTTTTCTSGYTLGIASSGSDRNLYLNGNSANNTSAYTVISPLSSTTTLSTNNWGYSTTNSTITGTFTGLTNTSTTINSSNSATPVAGTLVPVYYGVKVASTATPGAYTMPSSGAIIYTLTMNVACTRVNISYDGNNATAGTMGAVHQNVQEGSTIDLVASNYSKTGYGFAGWSVDPNAGAKLVDNDTTNNPIVYGPQETVTIPDGFLNYDTDNDGEVKLYAVWIPAERDPSDNTKPLYLQNWAGCAGLDTATYDSNTGILDLTKRSVTALTDQRDNDVYAVARLADGNCWMIENLRLDADATRGNNINDPTITNEMLAQGYGKSTTYGNFIGLANAESAGFSSTYTANSLYYSGTQEGTATINIGTSDNPGYRMPRYNNANTQSRASNPAPTSNWSAMYSYGNYYTWHAVVADLTLNVTNNKSTTDTSLCPNGWHLPTGGAAYASGNTSGVNVAGDTSTFREFYNLGYKIMDEVKTAYEDTPNGNKSYYSSSTTNAIGKTAAQALRSFPNNFLNSGYFNTSSVNNRGGDGFYWSSTARGSIDSYGLYLGGSNVYPGTHFTNKYLGRSIRCVASDPETYTLSYNANGGSGAPSSQSTIANGSATFTINSTAPTRSGYTFTGWTDEKGNEAQPGGIFRTKDVNTTLYAVWTNNSCNPNATTIGTGNTTTDAVCLQDVKLSMKSSLPMADASTGTYTLIDARDNQTYTIAKLPDGNIWMTKNLNYGGSGNILLTSHDTDLPLDKTFMPPASTSTFSTGSNYYTTPQIQNNVEANSVFYGGYYSFAAAIASTTAYSASNQNITTSICPKGWDLPTSANYTNLKGSANLTNYATASVAPYSFTYGGYKNGTSFPTQTSRGDLWTSTNQGSGYSQGLYITSSAFTLNTSNNSAYYKYYGRSVRCIADNGTGTIHYDANGGTGTMTDQTGEINSMASIQSNSFTAPNDHKQFKNWNTEANGSGTNINPGNAASTIVSNGNTATLYAIWNDVYIFSFVNTATNATASKNVVVGQSGTVASPTSWSRTGYKLVGWDIVTNDASDNAGTVVYTNGQSITPASDMTFYTVWRPVYTIQYDGNGASNPNGMGTTDGSGVKSVKQTNIVTGDPVTLLPSNFKRTGYSFIGWSTNPNATPTSGDKIYGPMETIEAPAYPASGNIITMYAVWLAAEKDGNNKPIYLQDWNGCSSLTKTTFDNDTGIITPGGVVALTDKRDNEVYAIARLADGNCWMIENLRLEHEGTVGQNINDPSVTNQSLSQGYGGTTGTYGNFVGLAASESANLNNTTTSLSFADGGIYKSSASSPTDIYNPTTSTLEDIGSTNYPGYRFPRYNNSNNASALSSPTYTENYASASSPSTNGTYKGSTVSSYGNYYTWAAAMANTNYYTNSSDSESADTSICPVGWHLPSSNGTNKEYGTLSREYGGTGSNQNSSIMSNRFRTFPNNFLYSGDFNGSSARYRGDRGSYWSRSAGSYNNTYGLWFYSASIYPSGFNMNDYFIRSNGFSVRCLINDTYLIQYDGNGATNPNGMGTTDSATGIKSVKQTNVNKGSSVTLLPSNFKRTGYSFIGWSTNPNATPTSGDKIYGPMETIEVPRNSGNIITMYAVWLAAAKDSSNRPVYLQNWQGCASLATTTFDNNTGTITPGGIVALTDKRDNQVYAIARLADGNCWMIENLRLESTNTIGATNEGLAQGYSKYSGSGTNYGSFTGLANPETSNFTDSTTANSLYSTTTSGTKNVIGTSGNPGTRFPRYNNSNTQNLVDSTTYTQNHADPTNPIETGGYLHGNTNIYSYGNYYTWPAAMANTNYFDFFTNPSSSEVAGTSICPSGWFLPSSGNSSKDFGILSQRYGGTGSGQEGTENSSDVMDKRFRTYPNNFLYSGGLYNSTIGNRGWSGYYWSRSISSVGANHLYLDASYVNPSSGAASRSTGFSVRCLISPPTISDLTYLQDFSALSTEGKAIVLDSMEEDAQYQLKDSRDDKTYWISKLKDGHVWMTQNLDLDLGVNTLTHNSTTLYHDDTDLGWGSDTATTTWTPANATINVSYNSNMKGTFSSLGTDEADNYVPKSLNVGDWYYAGYNGTNLLPNTTVNYLTSNNRTTNNGTTTVNNGSGVNYFSTAPFTGNGTSNNGTHGHIGNYYNWSAAVASNNTAIYSESYSDISNSPQNSICPAGWRLPTITNASPDYTNSNTKNEFARLIYLYNNNNYVTNSSIKLESNPLYLVRAGYVFGNALGNSGYSGVYWSNTAGVNTGYYIYFRSDYIDPQTYASRYDARSVRCLAR